MNFLQVGFNVLQNHLDVLASFVRPGDDKEVHYKWEAL